MTPHDKHDKEAVEREEFEHWASSGWYSGVSLEKESGGAYRHPGVQNDWTVWQARAALSAPAPVAEQPQIESKANSLGGFRGGFIAVHRRAPTEQEIWNAAVKSGMRRAEPVAAPAQAVKIAYESILAEAERRKSHYGQTVGYESDRDKEHCIGFWVHQVMSERLAIEARKEQG